MADDRTPLFEVRDVIKDYHGLRPLRLKSLTVEQGESVALVGLDLEVVAALEQIAEGARDGARLRGRHAVQMAKEPGESVRQCAVEIEKQGIHGQ